MSERWHDKSEKLPDGDYLLAIVTDENEYILRPKGWLHRVDGGLKTVGNYGKGYAVEKYYILPFYGNAEGVYMDKKDSSLVAEWKERKDETD